MTETDKKQIIIFHQASVLYNDNYNHNIYLQTVKCLYNDLNQSMLKHRCWIYLWLETYM